MPLRSKMERNSSSMFKSLSSGWYYRKEEISLRGWQGNNSSLLLMLVITGKKQFIFPFLPEASGSLQNSRHERAIPSNTWKINDKISISAFYNFQWNIGCRQWTSMSANITTRKRHYLPAHERKVHHLSFCQRHQFSMHLTELWVCRKFARKTENREI